MYPQEYSVRVHWYISGISSHGNATSANKQHYQISDLTVLQAISDKGTLAKPRAVYMRIWSATLQTQHTCHAT